jgi:predicted lipoprotein
MFCLVGCVDKSRDIESSAQNSDSTYIVTDVQTDSSSDTFDRSVLMTNLVDNIFIPNYQSTALLAEAFSNDSGSLASYCDAVGTTGEAAALDAVKTGWLAVMDAVQKTEMHVLGPALRNDEALQKRIHSYSTGTLASCALDQAVIESAGATFDVSSRAFNQRGMSAVEYLLFNSDLNHSCSSQVAATADWNNLNENDRKTQRCELAQKLANDITDASSDIYTQWVEGDNSYRAEFLLEEKLGENFQLITDGMFYLETFTKSQKLRLPLGLDDSCSSVTCPNLVESPYSESSLLNIETNTNEFLRIFNGGDGVGFDDLINAEEYAEITLRFQSQLNDVSAKIKEISTPLVDQVALVEADATEQVCINAFANPDQDSDISACSLAGLLKRVTDDLKIEFVTIVGVALPGRVQSDND